MGSTTLEKRSLPCGACVGRMSARSVAGMDTLSASTLHTSHSRWVWALELWSPMSL